MAGNKIPGFEIAVNDYRSVSLVLGCKVVKYDKFSLELNNICRFLAAEHYLFTPHIGEVFGVFIQEKNTWFRGKIKNYYNQGSGITYEVFLIDIGSTVRVPKPYLVPLNELMKKYKPQVLKFGIYGVVPNVALGCKARLLLSNLFNSGTVHFVERVTIKNVVFGDVFIKETDKIELVNVATLLSQKGVVKISDNFTEDIIPFCKVFEGIEEVQDDSVNAPNNNLENSGSVTIRQMQSDDYNIHQREKINVSPAKTNPDTGYSSSEETRFVHEDTIFVPAGSQFSEKKKETTRRSSRREIKIPRTYYEIKRDKKKEENKKSSRNSECRPADRSENEGMLISHNKELKGSSPHRDDTYNSEIKADTTEPVFQPKQVTWGSTICNDGNLSMVSEPQVVKTKAFSLNFRKEGNTTNMNEKQVLSLSSDRNELMNQEENSSQLNYTSDKAEDNVMSGSCSTAVNTSLTTSPTTSIVANTSISSSSSLNVTKNSFVNLSINSSLSNSEQPYLSSRQKFRLKYNQEMQEMASLEAKRKGIQVDSSSVVKEVESIVSVSNSCGNLPNPNVTPNTSITSNLSSSFLNASINNSVNSSISSASSTSNSEQPYLSNRQKFRLKYNQEKQETALLEEKRKDVQLENTSAGKEKKSIVSVSNSCGNLSNSIDTPNTSNISNILNTSNLTSSSLNASKNSSVNLSIGSTNSTSDSEQPYMSNRQKFRLKYNQEKQETASLETASKSVQFENTSAEKERELILSVSNSSGNPPNSNATAYISASISSTSNDYNLKSQKEIEVGMSDIHADTSKGSQTHLSDSRLQNNISGEQKIPQVSSNIISERMERHRRMEAVMGSSGVSPSDEDDFSLVSCNQHLVRLMKTAAGVLVHSKTDQAMLPVTILSDIGLDSRIIQSLEKWNMREMSRVQNVSYRMISKRRNLVMVGSRSSGKTTGYVVPIASNLLDSLFYRELPAGSGPRALIITPSWKAGLEVTTMFRDLTKYISVIHTYGGGAEQEMKLELLNGSDVLVSTPRCLLRLLKLGGTDFKRLCHLVMDDAHILFEKFKPEMEQIMVRIDKMEDRRLKQGLKMELQVVVASSHWTVPIKELSVSILANPTIVIASQLEACVYADVKPVACLVKSNRKTEKLVELLNGIKGQLRTVVVCQKKDDVKLVYRLLTDLGMENVLAAHEDLTSVNISEIPQMWQHKKKDVITSWQNSQGASLPILIRSDELRELPITDAQVLIHYNMPASLKIFSLRFICLIDNFRNILRQEDNVPKKKCQVHILMDEDNNQEVPGVMEFMKRLGTVLPTQIEQMLETLEQNREEEKLKEPLCENLKEFGHCWDPKKCPNRHVFSTKQDLPQDIPKSGKVKILIQHVHDACHFSARLLEHSEKKGEWRKLPSKMLELCLEINVFYKEKKNRRLHGLPSVGDLVGVESSHDTFHRAVVLKITKVNKHGEPESVNLRLIDNGSYFEDFSVMYLYQLPASLSSPPPQLVDVYLCSLMPKDLDTCWSLAVNTWVETHLRDARRHSPKGYLEGKIVLSLGKNVWLEPIRFMEDLPELNTTVFKFSLRQDILNTNNALENPDHLPNLYKLCEKARIDIPKEEPEQTKPQNLVQAKPRWAWLPLDNSEAVHVVTVQDPNVIFVRLSYNSDCLERLMKEIQEFVKKQKNLNDVKQLDIGGVCLAKAPDAEEWNRAVIRSKPSEDQVELFFVDYGDIATLTWNEVAPISDDLIKKLPFQVIECYLADVLFVESDDNSWEDDVIDQIYNLTRNENEEAINLHVQVCGVESVGTLSSGKRYKVILTDTNKEEAVVINKEINSPNIINCTGDDEKNVKTGSDNELASRSSSSEQQKSEKPCFEITTMIHNESGSHVLLPDQFNIDENVAANEKERRVLEFLNYFDKSTDFEFVSYEHELLANEADVSTNDNNSGSSILSMAQPRESMPQEPQPSSQRSSSDESLLSVNSKNKEICEILNKEYLTTLPDPGLPELPLIKNHSHSASSSNQNHQLLDKEEIEKYHKIAHEMIINARSSQKSEPTPTCDSIQKSEPLPNCESTPKSKMLPSDESKLKNESSSLSETSIYSLSEISAIEAAPTSLNETVIDPNTSNNYFNPTNVKHKVTGVFSKFTDLIPTSLLSPKEESPSSKLNLLENVKPSLQHESMDETERNDSEEESLESIGIEMQLDLNELNKPDVSPASSEDILNMENTAAQNQQHTSTKTVVENNEESNALNSIKSSLNEESIEELDPKNTSSDLIREQDISGIDQSSTKKWIEDVLSNSEEESVVTESNEPSTLGQKDSQKPVKNSRRPPNSGSDGYIPNEEDVFNCPVRIPQVEWHQDETYIWLYIKLPSVKLYRANWELTSFKFRTVHCDLPYEMFLELYTGHKPESVQLASKAFHFEIRLEKLSQGKKYNWPRLTQSENKPHWLKVNVEKACEDLEDSEDEDLKPTLCPMTLMNDVASDSESQVSDLSDASSLACSDLISLG